MSQMTDAIGTTDVATQTLLPRVPKDDITNAYLFDIDQNDNNNTYDVAKKVKDQIKKIRYLHFNEEINAIVESTSEMQGANLKHTLASWHFEDDLIDIEAEQHFIPYTIEPFKPWSSFIPFPFRLNGNNLIGRQKIDWCTLLQSIDNLIRESNQLVDKLEGIIQDKNAQRQNELKSLDNIRKFAPTTFRFPSEQWLPIIEKQEMELQALMDSK